VLGVALTLGFGLPAPLQAQVPEHQLKAAFIFNFVVFTEWPPGMAELRLCVSRGSELFTEIKALDGRRIEERRLEIVPVGAELRAEHCEILLIDGRTVPPMPAPEPPIPGQLTIVDASDSDEAERSPAIIQLVREEEHVRFDINASAARSQSVRLSSRLLNLARRLK